MEVNATYQGPGVYALYRVEPRWWVNAGIKKSFLADQLELSLNVNDIFKSQRLITRANVGEDNISDFNQYFRTRNVGFTLRYKFSKGEKINDKRRNSSLDELNRVGN